TRSVMTDDLQPEYFHVVVISDQQLDEALCVAAGDRARYATVVEGYHSVVDPLLARTHFIQPHAGDFGLEEHDRTDIFVHQLSSRISKNLLHRISSLQLPYVHKGDVGRDIANGVYVVDIGLRFIVFDAP